MPAFRYDIDNNDNNKYHRYINNHHNSNNYHNSSPLDDPSPVAATPSTGTKARPVLPLRSALKSTGHLTPSTPLEHAAVGTGMDRACEEELQGGCHPHRREHPLHSDAAAARSVPHPHTIPINNNAS